MFKIINFLEKDEGLYTKREKIRDRLKEFKKVAHSSNTFHSKKPLSDEYNDHPKIKNYKIGKVLGEGSYAIVRLAETKEDGKQFAIKIYDKLKNFDVIKRNN